MSRSSHDYWEHYDHEADMGIRGVGSSLSAAFEQAALALTAIVTHPADVQPETRIDLSCEAPDDELLFVEWLNVLVYEMAVRKMLFSRFQVQHYNGKLTGQAWGESVDVERHHPAVEVKGATLTTLSVCRNENDRWVAQTVVDV